MTHGGLNQFYDKKFVQFLTKDRLSDNQVRTIYCDKSGNIWIEFNGNRKSSLPVYNGKILKTYTEANRLCNKRIRAIYEDKNGKIWLGSTFGKLMYFRWTKFL
ncbi:two-component regulator propeller domain-containing protein [Pontimicrobium sp. MEBiC06410]